MPLPADRKSNSPLARAVLRIVATATLLFVVVMGFTFVLSSSMLSSFVRDTYLSAYHGIGEQLRFSLERGLRFGRPLDGYAGLREQLANAGGLAGDLTGMGVVGDDGALLCQSGRVDMSAELRAVLADAAGDAEPFWRKTSRQHVILFPLLGRARAREGGLFLLVDNEGVSREYRRFLWQGATLLGVVTIVLVLIQSGWVAFTLRGGGGDPRRSLYLVLFLFVGGGQAIYFLPSAFFFSGAMDNAMRHRMEITGKIVTQDLERLAHKGLGLEQILGMSAHFGTILEKNPEIAAISLSENGRILAGGGESPAEGARVSLPVNVYWPDRFTPAREIARLDLWPDSAMTGGFLRRLLLNQATSLVISLLLAMELARMLISLGAEQLFGRAVTAVPAGMGIEEGHRKVAFVRVLGFVFFFGYDMVLSFVPLAAASLPGGVWPVPEAQLTALPITAEAVAGAVGIFAAGRLFDRVGMRRGLYAGITLAMIGAGCASLAPAIAWFVLGRAIAGFGFGVVFLSCQLGLLAEEGGAGDIAQFYSGLFVGSLCGVACGAMAAEFFEYRNVFAFSIVSFLAALAVVKASPLPGRDRPDAASSNTVTRPRFFISREFLAPVLLVALPISLSLAGFVNLGVPLQLNRLGVNQSDIGRLFMLYSLCFIVLGPWFAKLADRSGRYGLCVALSGCVNGLALVCAWAFPCLAGYAVAVVLAGVANTLIASSVMPCVTGGIMAKHCAKSMVGSVYRLVERFGHMAGPLAFSLLLADFGGNTGVLILGTVFFLGGLAFILTLRPRAPGRRLR